VSKASPLFTEKQTLAPQLACLRCRPSIAIRRSASHLGLDPSEPKFAKTKFVDKNVYSANWIVFADPVFQAFGKQCALTAIRPFSEAPHLIPAHRAGLILRITPVRAFLHSRSEAEGSC
jgi:hypothetical protein